VEEGRDLKRVHANRLLYTRVASADGEAIPFFSRNITVSPDGAWRFEVSPLGAPVGAELIVADQLDGRDYPFTLVPL
jgi:hypothetical protein